MARRGSGAVRNISSTYNGAAFAALAVATMGQPPDLTLAQGSRAANYLRTNYRIKTTQPRLGTVGVTSLNGVLTRRDGLVAETAPQRDDGNWSLDGLGGWRWDRTVAPFQPPGTRDPSLIAQSDGYATGLIVYAQASRAVRRIQS
jgi:hypothetical protein